MAPRKPKKAIVHLASTAVGLLVATGLLAWTPSSVRARPCTRIQVGVSKHVIKPGRPLRVRGATCAAKRKRPRFVRVKVRTRHGWRQIGIARTRATGRFSRRVRPPRVSARSRRTVLKVVAGKARSSGVPLKVADSSSSSPATNCPLANPDYEVSAAISGCRVIASDTAAVANPTPFWGKVDCGVWPNELDPNRPTRPASGGDAHPMATGAAQGNDAYRSLTTFDGDDVSGERCELGLNDSRNGPTVFYHEGQRLVTYISIRLPGNLAVNTEDWQTVMQMKQTQPANNGGGVPILMLDAMNGKLTVDSDHGALWSFPAQTNVWTRLIFDVTYSQSSNVGSIQIAADLNGDGDVGDPSERSPRIRTATLRAETAGPQQSPFRPGESIPSHLRVGPYHNSAIPCPRPTGCSVDVDNVQVVGL
jgi:hypothetical protein